MDGSGLRIGILSDSFDTSSNAKTNYMDDIMSGDLPSGIQILKDFDNGSDEGRAMAQLMFDLVPGATFSFYTAFESIQDFADGIQMLASMDCDVIVDDIRALTEPAFQDGIIAQAANKVAAEMNVPYFSSAGNQRDNAWTGPFRDSGTDLQLVTGGGALIKNLGSANDFDPSTTGNTIRQRITTTGTGRTTLVLQWDDPFFTVSGSPGADSDVDILVVDAGTTSVVASDFIDNRGGDAVALVSFPSGSYDIVVTVANGPFPSQLKWFAFGSNTVSFIEFDTNSSTSYGQPNQPFTAGVGAAFFQDTPEFGQSPPILEPFSSKGGTPLIFNGDGSRKSSPLILQQPRFVATDGNINTFFGNQANFQPNGQGFYFFGTYRRRHTFFTLRVCVSRGSSSSSTSTVCTFLSHSLEEMFGKEKQKKGIRSKLAPFVLFFTWNLVFLLCMIFAVPLNSNLINILLLIVDLVNHPNSVFFFIIFIAFS